MQILVRADGARAEKNKRKRSEEFRDQLLRRTVHSKVSVRGKKYAFDSTVCILAGMRRGAPALLTKVSPDSRDSINCAEASPRGARDLKTSDRSARARALHDRAAWSGGYRVFGMPSQRRQRHDPFHREPRKFQQRPARKRGPTRLAG